uniref:Venom allergen-like (VAL) 21 protein n=1 Tax=Schistosoma mansoni TaxID=6183 RepID=A0A3Q0KR02_SCHMA
MRSTILCLTCTLFILSFFNENVYCNNALDKNSRELLELHRKYRQDLVDCKVDGQPPAKYMSPLKWNHDLARQAQSLANKCILRHDKRHSNQFSWVGQNIALHPTIKSGVDAWFNEHKLYNYNMNNCPQCLHYTQMAWAKTTDIGCGVANCPRYGLSIVCNYGPGGNWNNEKPYEVKPRHMCSMMQNIPQNSLQTNSAHTQHGQKPIKKSEERVSRNMQYGRRIRDLRVYPKCRD